MQIDWKDIYSLIIQYLLIARLENSSINSILDKIHIFKPWHFSPGGRLAGIGASKDPDIYVVFISFNNIKTTSLKAFSLSASSANSLGSIFKMTWVVTKLDS